MWTKEFKPYARFLLSSEEKEAIKFNDTDNSKRRRQHLSREEVEIIRKVDSERHSMHISSMPAENHVVERK